MPFQSALLYIIFVFDVSIIYLCINYLFIHIKKLDVISRIKFKIFIGNVSYISKDTAHLLHCLCKMADVGIGNP